MAYVVLVKPSARRENATAGEYVQRNGPRRRFPDKERAREWAGALSATGGDVVVQDAHSGPADGWLVRKGDRSPRTRAGRQAAVDRFGP